MPKSRSRGRSSSTGSWPPPRLPRSSQRQAPARIWPQRRLCRRQWASPHMCRAVLGRLLLGCPQGRPPSWHPVRQRLRHSCQQMGASALLPLRSRGPCLHAPPCQQRAARWWGQLPRSGLRPSQQRRRAAGPRKRRVQGRRRLPRAPHAKPGLVGGATRRPAPKIPQPNRLQRPRISLPRRLWPWQRQQLSRSSQAQALSWLVQHPRHQQAAPPAAQPPPRSANRSRRQRRGQQLLRFVRQPKRRPRPSRALRRPPPHMPPAAGLPAAVLLQLRRRPAHRGCCSAPLLPRLPCSWCTLRSPLAPARVPRSAPPHRQVHTAWLCNRHWAAGAAHAALPPQPRIKPPKQTYAHLLHEYVRLLVHQATCHSPLTCTSRIL